GFAGGAMRVNTPRVSSVKLGCSSRPPCAAAGVVTATSTRHIRVDMRSPITRSSSSCAAGEVRSERPSVAWIPADLGPERAVRRVGLRTQLVELRGYLPQYSGTRDALQFGALLGKRQGSQGRTGALQAVGCGQDRGLVLTRGRIGELREHERQAIEECLYDL